MRRVRVNASSSYDILIGRGLLRSLGEHTKSALGCCRVCIVTDDTVDSLYGSPAEESLRSAGLDTIKLVIPHGEQSKSTTNLIALAEFMAENRLTRSDAVVALGGGVVGDLAGFCAATYLRGIPFIQVPTTLLAAVDSSVGGKTAVDLRAGKNLFGAFHQPSLVLCDPDTLSTLPPDTFADGCAEVIKYGAINDRALFDRLRGGIANDIENIIAECVIHKSNIVQRDEFDKGERMLLNFGHTVGHAIETCSGFGISHGSAVAIGMSVITRAAVKMGLCPESELCELIELLTANGLPTVCPYSARELAAAATADKKRVGDIISFIIPCGIGNCQIKKIPIDSLEDLFEKGL